MANTQPLWESGPVPRTPTSVAPKQPERRRVIVHRTINGFSTDIHEWLNANTPRSFNELMDLRRALYSFRSHGIYRVRYRGEVGDDSFVVVGPAGRVLITTNRTRYYLLRQLSHLRRAKRWPPLTRK